MVDKIISAAKPGKMFGVIFADYGKSSWRNAPNAATQCHQGQIP
jgi:hypothetical protein